MMMTLFITGTGPASLPFGVVKRIGNRCFAKFLKPKLSDFCEDMCRGLDAERFAQTAPKRHRDLRQAYPWICREFSRILDAQEIGADQVKNRSI